MFIVTGTKRSGTSLWMQILVEAGLPYIGKAFPGPWEQSIGQANKKGFYESRLRQGVFYATNPDPRTGEWLHPDAVQGHAVKVFIPGLVRTDFAYIGKVVATMRHWSDYGPSLRRLYAMEDEYLRANPPKGREDDPDLDWVNQMRSSLPGPVDWFLENYDLIRDFAVRRYPINFCTYERLLEDPEPMIRKVFGWLGTGDVSKALTVVEPKLRTRTGQDGDPEGVSAEHIAVFDELHDALHRTQSLSTSLLEKLNQVNAELVEEHGAPSKERARLDMREPAAPAE